MRKPCSGSAASFYQHHLRFVQQVQHLGGMAGEEQYGLAWVGFRVSKQVEHGLQHVRVEIGLELINDRQTTFSQHRQQARQQHKGRLRAARLLGEGEGCVWPYAIAVNTEGNQNLDWLPSACECVSSRSSTSLRPRSQAWSRRDISAACAACREEVAQRWQVVLRAGNPSGLWQRHWFAD